MSKQAISSDQAPRAVGPYSQAIVAGGFVFTAGQVAIDPATGKLVEGDAQVQAQQVLSNLASVLAAAGASFADVVKTTVFLQDMQDFPALNAVYAKAFDGHVPPARSTVAVAALPLGARVEIELVAWLGQGGQPPAG
jgi:2-iminobutanoate/2-iminopropanoate deaminase